MIADSTPSSSQPSPSPPPSGSVSPRRSITGSRTADLWLIALAVAVVATGVWALGVAVDSSVTAFAGFMIGACTFVPLPADAWVLHAAADNPAWIVGLLGGFINAVVILVERDWVLRLVDHPFFDTFQRFVGTNRYVGWVERHLFIGLTVGGFTFIPFEPFRLVAILRDYSPARYALATFLGRGFRYYILARVGAVFADLGVVTWVVWASIALFAVGLIRSYRDFTKDRATGRCG